MCKLMLYSFQPEDRIFVKGYGFFSIAKNMVKNIDENISKKLSGEYIIMKKYQKKDIYF